MQRADLCGARIRRLWVSLVAMDVVEEKWRQLDSKPTSLKFKTDGFKVRNGLQQISFSSRLGHSCFLLLDMSWVCEQWDIILPKRNTLIFLTVLVTKFKGEMSALSNLLKVTIIVVKMIWTVEENAELCPTRCCHFFFLPFHFATCLCSSRGLMVFPERQKNVE